MKNTFAKKFTVCALAGVLGFALTACDDSSSAGGDNGSNRGGIPDTVETFMELSDYDCGKSQKCVATYLTEYHDMAVCDGNNGWVIGTLIEKMDCDFSSSSVKSSDSKSNDPAEVTDDSSDSNSSGTTRKSSSSSAGKVDCSALLEGETGWSWEVPKECRLNPEITYGTMTDERDGQVYKTVKIGDQTWMAENLNFDPGQGGLGENKYDWSWCYDNVAANCDVAGRLYTWAAAIDSIKLYDGGNGVDCGYGKNCMVNDTVYGICPPGWHLPAYMEWQALFDEVGGQSAAGSFFKSLTGWYSGGNGIDVYGFSALPVGNYYNGYFTVDGRIAVFWSTMESEYRNEDAYGVALGNNDDGAYLNKYEKNAAFSVRCIKDSE